MRLFVNVYHPKDSNVVHLSRERALAGCGHDPSVEAVEIEYPGTFVEAERDLEDFSADGLRAHYSPSKVSVAPSVPSDATDAVTVGDLNSSDRGSGARKSAGKPDWSLFPWWVMPMIFRAWKDGDMRQRSDGTYKIIALMADWQRGKDSALDEAAALLLECIHAPGGRLGAKSDGSIKWFPATAFESCVRVLEFGAIKYKKGNWARGMPWTVVFNSCMSHLTKSFYGEENDAESGLNHLAHAMCNMVFLLSYRDLFPEGDDRLPEFRPGGVAKAGPSHE